MNILKTISLIIIATSLLFSLASEDLKDMLFDNVSFDISKNDFLSKIDKNKTDIEYDGGNIIVLRLKDKKCNLLSSIRFINDKIQEILIEYKYDSKNIDLEYINFNKDQRKKTIDTIINNLYNYAGQIENGGLKYDYYIGKNSCLYFSVLSLDNDNFSIIIERKK